MKLIVWLCCLILLTAFAGASAQVRLPQIVRDSMILQRNAKVKIWGWASPKERIALNFRNKSYKTIADEKGNWMVVLSPMPAGGPYTMTIAGKNKITLHDILVGDVWFCSGQSNMVHQMKLHNIRYAADIAQADYSEIRQFWIPTLTNLQGPVDTLPSGYWKSADSENIADFSAVAYFFARKLYEKYHVPVGIINSSVGGTPIEAWMSEEGFKGFPTLLKTVENNKDTAYVNRIVNNREGYMDQAASVDKGINGPVPWYDPAYVSSDEDWRQIGIPGYWEDQGVKGLDGIVWYRKEIDVPAVVANKQAKVFLGRIVDADALYINGREIAHTTYQYPQRRYEIPPGVLKPGKNLFVIRVTNYSGKGGFVPDKPYALIGGKDTVDLKGYWQYKVGEVFPRQSNTGRIYFSAQNEPTALYNAMVAPVINYTIKGIAWYQGASNVSRAAGYASLQQALIRDWRSKWQEGDMPFLYVQLPGFGDYNYHPSESQWALLREGQLEALAVPNTAMAVTIDLGEWNDIHPDRKKPVGDRLALAAEKIVYGENVVYSGPVYRASEITGSKIIVSFNHVGGGLIFKDSTYASPGLGQVVGGFTIAGADQKFVWAKAKIIAPDKIEVWNDAVKDPLSVRYAWADDPVAPELYNKEGLPASPFRTDAW